MIAAAGSGMAAVDHELVGAEAGKMGLLVEAARDLDRLAPTLGRVDVYFDHAGIGRHLDDVDARIGRRRVAFDLHRHRKFRRRRFDCRQQFDDNPRDGRAAA